MANFETAQEVLETSANSAGSAMKEHEKYMDSIEARLNKLSATWQSLSQSFLSSNFLKTGISIITGFVNAIDKLIQKIGVLPTLLGTIGIVKLVKDLLLLKSEITSVSTLMKAFGAIFPNLSNVFTGFFSTLSAGQGVFAALKAAASGLWTVIAAHPILAVVAAVGLGIAAFAKWHESAEELAEKVDELTSKFKEQSEELQKLKGDYDTSNESSMISKYEKLSKGVDGLGRNVSLTADEYSEYQSIVNSIADQIPSLVSGYDEQGNALLSCKGNVEALTEAYEKLIHAQNQEILSSNAGDIEKNWKNAVSQASGYDFWEKVGNALSLDGFFGGNLDYYDMKTSTAQWLSGLTSKTTAEEINNRIGKGINLTYEGFEVVQALQNAGYDVNIYSDIGKVLSDALENEPEKIKGILDNYYAQFDDAVATYKTKATALLSEAFDISSSISGLNYSNISEELQEIAYQTVNSLDFDFLSDLTEQGKTIDQWTKELLNQLNSISKINREDIEDAFDLQAEFNGGDIDYGDYVDKLREVEGIIDSLDLKDEAKTQLKISLGLDENGVVDQYDALMERLTSKGDLGLGLNEKSAKKFLDSLSAEELSIAMDIIPKLDAGTTIDEIRAMIDEQMATEFTFSIDVQTEGIEALNTALAESRSATGLTTESIEALKSRYEDLDSFNAAALFEKTANGIHLNSEELARLEELYANTNKLEIDKQLDTLITKYNDLTKEIESCTDAADKEALQIQADTYKDKIEELQTLASQYDGLTSAFNKWQTALNGSEEGDNYDSLYENLEDIKELYEGGLVGTDKFKTAAQLMTNKDLSTADIDEIVSAYEKGYPKMQRYFTEGQQGCKNFLNDVSKLNSEWAHMNEDGSWEINFNAEEVAKELGVSVDAVDLIARKLKDYGFEVNLDDSSVDSLQTKIEKTEAKLKELGQSPVDINVDIEASSENLGTIEAEIEKAKSKIAEINNSSVSPEVKTAQLDDAKAKLEALIDKKQEASQPAFMNLDTSQVNASLVEALEKVQDYQNALNELNKLNELKEAGITIDDSEITSAQEKVDECAKAIQGLDGDVKVAIGLEEDGSIDSIKKAFEDGKVKIDADTDPALTKIEQLAENVDKIEDKDVTINVTVNGLDDVKELNKQINLATDIDGDIDKLSEYVKSAKQLSELDGNIASFVTANVRGNVVDTKDSKLERLKTFAGSAKQLEELRDVGSFAIDIDADVKANVKGNITEIKETAIDNLSKFAEEAQILKEANIGEDTKVEVKANIKGNVTETKEIALDNLSVFAEEAKVLKDANIGKDTNVKVTAKVSGNVIETKEIALDNLSVFAEEAQVLKDANIGKDEVAKITASVKGNVVDEKEIALDNLSVFAEEAKALKDVEIGKNNVSSVTANVYGNVIYNKEIVLENLSAFAEEAKVLKEADIGTDTKASIMADIKGNVVDKTQDALDNLSVFAEQANALKEANIGTDTKAKITADIKGNVVEEKDSALDNIDAFIKGAKALKDAGIGTDTEAKITANVKGNVTSKEDVALENLSAFAEEAKALKDAGIGIDTEASVKANVKGNVVNKNENALENLGAFAKEAKALKKAEIGTDTEVSINANVRGNVVNTKEIALDNLSMFAEEAKKLKSADIGTDTNVSVTANVNGNVIKKEEASLGNLSTFANEAKTLSSVDDVVRTVSANARGNVIEGGEASNKLSSLTEFKSIVSGMSNQTVTVSVKANVDSENINKAIQLLKDVSSSGVFKDYKATVQVGAKVATIDDTVVQNYKASKKDGKVKYSVDSESSVFTWTAPDKDGVVNYSASVEALTDAQKHKTGTITYKAKIRGFPIVNGTANANGSAFTNGTSGKAFKQGDWGVKQTTTALTGELGRELVVYRNKFWTVGDNGAEFATIPRGAIVFNHKQTEELFANGRVTSDGGRGRALVEGNAFVKGKGKFYNSVTGESYGSSSSGTDDDFEEVIDWIEVIIDRIERSIDKFDQQANNIYKSWSSRNTALQNQISEVGEEIALQQRAYNKYMSAANGVGLSFSWAEKVRNGKIDIGTITDETLKEKIDDYQKYYEAALDCKDAIEELREEESELYAQRFQNIQSEYDGILQGYEHTETMLNEYINQAEAQGHIVSKKYYEALIANEKSNISELKKEQSALIEARDEAVASGTITKNSEEWYLIMPTYLAINM